MAAARARKSNGITSLDVAARAGVSQPTVSLVLSGNPQARVSARTREKVLRAAEELGYRPNVLARSLSRGRSYALGVLVPDLRNPFFAEVVSGAQRVASEEGYAVLLSEAGSTAPAHQLESLRERQIDGVMIDAVGAASLPVDALAGLNVVLIDEPSLRWPGVASDAEGAGRMAAEHLLALGHRRFGFLGPATDVHGFRMRERGFTAALRAAGITVPSEWHRRTPATVAGGRQAMQALLSSGGERPTAVFGVNDLVAIGALKACSERSILVPRDMSIAGCDDIEMARLVTPELTTVTVAARELGARAARLLLLQLAGRPVSASRPLPVKLQARGTTAAPRS
jgi:LacI family transcriptional regulator